MKRNMKKTITVVLLLLIIASLPIFPGRRTEAEACEQTQEEDKVTGEIAASVLSAYIWRGQELSRHSVVIQPSMTASYNGFTANLWGNLDTKPYSARRRKIFIQLIRKRMSLFPIHGNLAWFRQARVIFTMV